MTTARWAWVWREPSGRWGAEYCSRWEVAHHAARLWRARMGQPAYEMRVGDHTLWQ